MTYDVQGQGDSDLAGEDCPGECTGVPYQQDYNFYQGAEDSLSVLPVGRAEPVRRPARPHRVGIAGHSLGAGAVSHVGQCDSRVKAIVAWDNLARDRELRRRDDPEASTGRRRCCTRRRSAWRTTTCSTPSRRITPPDPEAKADGYKQLVAAGRRQRRASCCAARRTSSTRTSRSCCRPASSASGSRRTTRGRGSTATCKGDASAFNRLDGDGVRRERRTGPRSAPASTSQARRWRTRPNRTPGNVPYTIEGIAGRERGVVLLPLAVLADEPGGRALGVHRPNRCEHLYARGPGS